ncbi:MAG: hypothetical protein HYV07_27875 [Deltaproteobacteria bacterium]|nr:hypothetical protein [Deltaproteobacteria bacterium]
MVGPRRPLCHGRQSYRCHHHRDGPELDPNQYEKGKKISPQEMEELLLVRSEFHGEWNCVILPRTSAPLPTRRAEGPSTTVATWTKPDSGGPERGVRPGREARSLRPCPRPGTESRVVAARGRAL